MTKPADIPQDVWDVAYRLHGFTEYDEVVARAGSVAELHAAVDHDVALIARAILAERARAIAACERQKASFASDEYATPQPLGGLMERFACDQCIEAIRKGIAA